MRGFPHVSVTALALVLAMPASSGATSRGRLVEGIVARVNDRIITTEDMRERLRERAAETGAPVPPDAIPDAIQEAADELVLIERAAELKLEVDEKQVDASVAEIKAANHITSEAAFQEQLARMGLTLSQLRERLRQTALIQEVLTKELGAFNITDEELRQRYEREKDRYLKPATTHLEHIVYTVAEDGSNRAAVIDRAARLVAAARAGDDFPSLVKADVAAGGASGGDLGSLALEDLRSEVRSAAEKLAPGQVSDPFESPAGIHVIRVVSRAPATPEPFEAVKAELRQREAAERYRSRLKGVVDELKKRYLVEVHPEIFNAANE
jgi:peptidyl-prolyl cis-trans isomerase SurA